MPRIGNFSASVRIEGRNLEEYDIQVDEGSLTATCWIASEVGKTYAVHWTDQKYRLPTARYVTIDGHHGGGSVMDRDDQTIPHEAFTDALYTTSTTKVPYTFSNIATSDDYALLSAPPAPDIGLIKLQIFQVRVISKGLESQNKAPEMRIFHEKTKKGISHQTSFERSVATHAMFFTEVERIGPPVAVFNFKYRPLGILQAEDIAPPPLATQRTSPSPPRPVPRRTTRKRYKMELDSDGEIIDHSDQDDEDAERLKDLQREIDAIRAKRDGERPRKKIKREPIVGETIDLTLEN
ncbi:hypothetical protein PM082_022613 [Marasmius tenuissimus]|nr:hypothetical protein PM082_022613 [Marasmius tenuissimus]